VGATKTVVVSASIRNILVGATKTVFSANTLLPLVSSHH
jgi:hypothetical protein